ncbi:MAG: hypothetical protein OXC14_02675 [Rhodospirillaceae bacterium]|nr:hypothetical protein [Rhodospirillaceae bacterium]
MQFKSTYLALAVLAGFGLALGACSSSSDDPPLTDMTEVPDPEPTPYETAKAAIAAATTASAVQAAYDAVKGDVTAAEGDMLQAAVDARIASLAMMDRAAAQKTTLMTAAGMVDTSDLMTAEDIDAANTAIAALQTALDAAADGSDADKAKYQAMVDAAEAAVMTAQGDLDMQGRMMVQRTAISDAVTAARTAVGAVNDDSPDADLTAADDAIAALRAAIAGAADLPEGDATVASGQGTLDTLEIQLASAKTSRMMAMDEAAEEQRQANIDAAKDVLTTAEAALGALAEDATDEERRDANRMVESAANALRDALRMNGGSDADIEAAIRKSAAAKVAADALQATITAAAEAEEQRKMNAIETAQTALTGAEEALAELGEDATDKETRDAHRAVEMAAAALIQVLEDNDGTADQISAATMKQNSAKMMADALTSPIEIADQRKAITDALTALATAVAAVDDEAADAEVTAADNAVTAARKAITDATELPEAEKSAHGLLVDAHASTLTSAKESRQIVVDKKAEEEQQMAKAASNKVALTKEAAIDTEGASETTLARPFDAGDEITGDGTPSAAAATRYDLSVKHTGSAVEFSVKDERNLAEKDPKFAKMEEFGNAQMLVRDIGTSREIIVAHTDIDAPTPTPFSKEYTLNAEDDPDTTAEDFSALTIITDSGVAENHLAHIDLGLQAAPKGQTTVTTFSQDNDATTTTDEGKHRGRFDGAMGAYDCGSAGCSVTVDDDGEVTTMVGTWVFTPDSGATVDVADQDYLTYGFWLDTTTKDGAIASYDAVQTFATSSLAESTGLDTVEGAATYEGDAAGVYVHQTKKEDGTNDTVTSGRFTADVTLKAYFEAVVGRTDNSLEGTISDFDLDGGPANSWSVDVSATFSDAGAIADGAIASGMTGDDGSLSGQFHGTGDADDATVSPPVLIGEFNANFTNGAVAGAYGTRKQP